MKEFTTEQEDFWFGEFGNDYIDRNNNDLIVASNLSLFSKILSSTSSINNVIEFGSNIGLNLRALDKLLPGVDLTAVEINTKAVESIKKWGKAKVVHESILNIKLKDKYDFSFIKGVLIHIDPEKLKIVYENLYNSSNKYIAIVEYYNPTPVEISYRGHDDRLFKRDFAGDMMKMYPDLKLIDYGFVYHKDSNFPQDDVTWFIMKK
jgi:spore coat polysaccharide biosynthesis protein SpsF